MKKQKIYHKKCLLCHNDFETLAPNTKYCCEECKAKAKKISLTIFRHKNYDKYASIKEKKIRKKSAKSQKLLADIDRQAEKMNMTYGQYVAYVEYGQGKV